MLGAALRRCLLQEMAEKDPAERKGRRTWLLVSARLSAEEVCKRFEKEAVKVIVINVLSNT